MASGVRIAGFEGFDEGFEDFDGRLFEGPASGGGGGGGAFEGICKAIEFGPAGGGDFENDETAVGLAGMASDRETFQRIENPAWYPH